MERKNVMPRNDFDRNFDRTFGIGFALILLLNVAIVAVGIWAAVQIVQWLTSK